MNKGLLIAILAYASFSWGDAVVKSLGGQVSVFVIGFFSTLAAAAVIFCLARPGDERWIDLWRMKHPWAVQARALAGVSAGLLGIHAFTTIPLAEAYALIFLAPLLVTILSGVALGEEVGARRWLAVAVGFAGVLLVVRPGFRAVETGHLAAFGVAICAACSVVLLRSLAGREKRTSILGVLMLYAIIIMGGLVLLSAPPLPSLPQLLWILLAGTCAGVGQIALLAATARSPASGIAPMQYSQIAWAVVLGTVFFGERPDRLALLGLLALAAAGLLTLMRERVRAQASP